MGNNNLILFSVIFVAQVTEISKGESLVDCNAAILNQLLYGAK